MQINAIDQFNIGNEDRPIDIAYRKLCGYFKLGYEWDEEMWKQYYPNPVPLTDGDCMILSMFFRVTHVMIRRVFPEAMYIPESLIGRTIH